MFETGSGASKLGSACSNEYITTDIDLASFLACKGLEPHRVDPPPTNTFPRFAAFVFPASRELDEAVTEWTSSRSLPHDLRTFLEQRRDFFQWARSVVKGGAQ